MDGEQDIFRFFKHDTPQNARTPIDNHTLDEYTLYIIKDRPKKSIPNPLEWWRLHQDIYPNLSRMAFDIFAVPAMSSECEMVFSRASYTIAARRGNLNSDIVEAGETLHS